MSLIVYNVEQSIYFFALLISEMYMFCLIQRGTNELMFACFKGHKDILEMLLKYPNININTQNKVFILFVFCKNDLCFNANMFVNEGRMDCIDACIFFGHKEIVEMLLKIE